MPRHARGALLTVLLVLASVVDAPAQGFGRPTDVDLRVEWSASEDRRGRAVVSGYVYNQRGGAWATGVRLLVEGLDPSGQVVETTTASVLGEVPPTDRSYFEIKPATKAASYRVTIQSFSWRAYGAGGG